MNKNELWKEITMVVDSTHFNEKDKELVLLLINEFGMKHENN